jgi:hypothetical protein
MTKLFEIDLARVPGDRRLYALDDLGTLRLEGLLMRAATAKAGAESWRFSRQGSWQRRITATDAAGEVIGMFRPRDIRRGGSLQWRGTGYTLRPHSNWRQRYALSHGERELAVLEAAGWWGWGTRRPARVWVDDRVAIDSGLLLFSAFVVRALADAANSDAGSTVAVTTTASSGG